MPLPARQQQSGRPACAACKYQRRRCTVDCPLARYFPHDQQLLFRNAHRLFGVSNIIKTLLRIGADGARRDDAMRAINFEAGAWDTYPAHRCLAVIAALLHQIHQEESQLRHLNAQLQHYRRLRLSMPTPLAADLPALPRRLTESSNMYFDEHYLSSSLYSSNSDDVAASLLWTMQPQYGGSNAVLDMAGVPKEQDHHHFLFNHHTSTGGQCSVQHEYEEILPFLKDIDDDDDDMPPFESTRYLTCATADNDDDVST